MTMLAGFSEVLGRGGKIVRRQTTFWDLQTSDGSTIRVHFDGKVEFGFVAQGFPGVEVTSSHPLLTEYKSPSDSLYIASSVVNPAEVLSELRSATATHFDGWRLFERYLNDHVSAEDLLREGYGLLLRGPREFVTDAASICSRFGIKVSVLTGARAPAHLSALILGQNFVIARAFRLEPIARGGT
jgi:hypothetical protein